MEDSLEELQAEFVEPFRKQVEALEVDAYVGLTGAERSEYHKRQGCSANLTRNLGKISGIKSLFNRGKLYGINEPSPRRRGPSLPDQNAGPHRA
jgi:hypothetical protein